MDGISFSPVEEFRFGIYKVSIRTSENAGVPKGESFPPDSRSAQGILAAPGDMNIAREKQKIVWVAHEGNKSGANVALLEYVAALKDVYDFHIILPHEGNMISALTNRRIPYSIIRQYGWAGKI